MYYRDRSWTIVGDCPREWGWYAFMTTSNRKARLIAPAEPSENYLEALKSVYGYVAGDRFIPVDAKVVPVTNPRGLVEQTTPVRLIGVDLGLFPYIRAAQYEDMGVLYIETAFDTGPEQEVREAFVDRLPSLEAVKNVTPALDLAFRFASHERDRYEAWRAHVEAERLAEQKRLELLAKAGTAAGRRELAQEDFEAAARAAIEIGGATFLRVMPTRNRREMAVQYAIDGRRFECIANKRTLRIVDSGICLTDELTGTKGDTRFTLESLPSVVRQAIREGALVVYRHV